MNTLVKLFVVLIIFNPSCRNSNEDAINTASPIDSDKSEIILNDQIESVEITNPDIMKDEFMGIKLGMNLSDLKNDSNRIFKKGILQTGDGNFEVTYILDNDKSDIGIIFPMGDKKPKVHMIVVTSPKYKTKHGLGVGNTLEDISKISKNYEIHGSEIEGQTNAILDSMNYLLDTNIFSYDVSPDQVPMNTKIKGVRIY